MREDLESGNASYPMVLVQIPMFNEKEVYKISIGAACNLSWPSDRLVIQVLDDSTDPFIKDEAKKWKRERTTAYQLPPRQFNHLKRFVEQRLAAGRSKT